VRRLDLGVAGGSGVANGGGQRLLSLGGELQVHKQMISS
jgi:hypothetical protein